MDKLREAYKTLGVPADSPLPVIRDAYRKLAKQYHPDSNPHDQRLSTSMMMKINEAYETVKWYMERGIRVEERSSYERAKNPYEEMIRRWDREKKAEQKERKIREQQRLRREEAYQRFFEQVARERQYELRDKRSFDTIKQYAGALVTVYYRNNLHNRQYRERPAGEQLFTEYLSRFDILLEKSVKSASLCRSKTYKRKCKTAIDFLRVFIEDAELVLPIGAERRAQAVSIFGRASDGADRFMSGCFTKEGFDLKEAKVLLKRALDDFEYFLASYPQSPLIEYAQRKLAVLEGAYRSFMTK
ncbi:MAG: J domain-containing protein [Spirochaetes bacterium]|nr:J domain-containing protein [Spirochaetota bacterium]